MPGSAAETRADACRPSGAAALPVQVPLSYWGGSAVVVSGFGPGFWPATPTSTITRTDLTDLRLSLQRRRGGSQWGGCRLGCAVRRLGLVPAVGGGRAAESVGTAAMRVRRASWLALGCRGWAGWWGR